MIRVEREVVEQEVAAMFKEHKTLQGVVESLLLEIGWDSRTILAAQKARQKKQEKEAKRQAEREVKREAKKKNKESPKAQIQHLAEQQKAEQVEDEKSLAPADAGEEVEEVETEEEPESSDEEVETEYTAEEVQEDE
jgi:hypothetical protein